MKTKLFFLACTISFASFISTLSNAQTGALNINIQSPNYFGGKGKKLTDMMMGLSYEYSLSSKDNLTIDAGFGFMWKIAPNNYHGTVRCIKYDYPTNQSMPSAIPVNYYYKQAGIGMQVSLDLKYYLKALDEGGLYFSAGGGFDMLSFKSHLDKFDDFNYYPDNVDYPETPDKVLDDYKDSTSTVRAGALDLRSCIGLNIFTKNKNMFFVECNFAITPTADQNKDAVNEIFSRRFLISPAIGIKF